METSNLHITEPANQIVFDTSSGISLEEQQEILDGINTMTAGTRLAGETAVTKAKKKGVLFPLLINIGALIILGLGFFLLSFFHNQDEQNMRESSAVLGFTERMLIQEIREETNRLINEKEAQINGILAKLSEADAEYRFLSESMESLTEAQMERAAYLLQVQEEYRLSLSDLRDERARILEDSRQREIALRTQAEETALALTHDLGTAMEELRRLGSEQERSARVENQMNGFYAAVNEQIRAGRLDEAWDTLNSMREFLASPSFHGISAIQTRRQTHLAAIAIMEEAVTRLKAEAPAFVPPHPSETQGGTQYEAQAEIIAGLTTRLASLEQELAALTAANSEQAVGILVAARVEEIVPQRVDAAITAEVDAGRLVPRNVVQAIEAESNNRQRIIERQENIMDTTIPQTVLTAIDNDPVIGLFAPEVIQDLKDIVLAAISQAIQN